MVSGCRCDVAFLRGVSKHVHVHDVLRDRIFQAAGLNHREHPRNAKQYLAELFRTEWLPDFENYMRARLVMGALRYGRNFSNRPKNKPQYDRLASARKRLDLYEQTGNDEILVDVANLMMLEYGEGIHPTKHFRAQDEGEHTKVVRDCAVSEPKKQ